MFIELIGAIASVILLTAYVCITTERWDRVSLRYQGASFVGSILLVVYGIAKAAYANVLLNVVWAAVGLYGLFVWYRRYMQNRKERARNLLRDTEDVL